jgi:hypothetical protein
MSSSKFVYFSPASCRTVQRDGICHEVLAPAPGLAVGRAREAQQLALELAAELDVTGLLAVKLFETPRGCWSTSWPCGRTTAGHWTIEGSRRRSSSSTGSVPAQPCRRAIFSQPHVQPKRACHPMTACTARCQEQRPERRSNDGQTILRYIQMWPTPTSCPDH